MTKSDAAKRRYFAPQEEMAILKRQLLDRVPVSDLCDEFAIAPNVFYRWQRELFENGHAAFEDDRKSKASENAKDRRIEAIEKSCNVKTKCFPNCWRSTCS